MPNGVTKLYVSEIVESSVATGIGANADALFEVVGQKSFGGDLDDELKRLASLSADTLDRDLAALRGLGAEVLGESREQIEASERGRTARLLKSLPWCDDEARGHEGYCRDAFRALIDGEAPIAGGRGGGERLAWRRLVYWTWRALWRSKRSGGT